MTDIPYVKNGRPPNGADCQSWVEFCLTFLGVTRNWKGSNDMWRNALSWRGTPEECKLTFGSIPDGAWCFIVKHDGGEKQKGYFDDLGNATHVGLITHRGAGAIHASSTNECVCESTFKDKTVPNGGWNMVGLPKDVDFFVARGVKEVAKAYVNTNGNGSLNLRSKPRSDAKVLIRIPEGTQLDAEEFNETWACASYDGKHGYVMSKFLSSSPPEGEAVAYYNVMINEGVAYTLVQAIDKADTDLVRLDEATAKS